MVGGLEKYYQELKAAIGPYNPQDKAWPKGGYPEYVKNYLDRWKESRRTRKLGNNFIYDFIDYEFMWRISGNGTLDKVSAESLFT